MVLIKDMDIPENCSRCPFREKLYCNASGRRKIDDSFAILKTKRADWCPIISAVNDSFGRLIDADELAYNAEHCIETTDAFIEMITKAETIIGEIKDGDACVRRENFAAENLTVPDKGIWFGLPTKNQRFISLFFDRSMAQKSVDEWGAIPVFGFEQWDKEGAPAEVYITAGGEKDPYPFLEGHNEECQILKHRDILVGDHNPKKE